MTASTEIGMRDDDTAGRTGNGIQSEDIPRRAVLRGVGAALAVLPFGTLAGCGNTGDTPGSGGTGGSGGHGGGGAGGGGSGGSGGAATTSSTTTTGDGGWASGGTRSMSGDYPDPFTDPLGSSCALTCSAILGPCYAETIERKDISEGYLGLPVRLAFLVVDEACNPVPGATVDVWHTRNNGIYSGDDTSPACHMNDPEAIANRYFRGVQSTDEKGRVDFDTCYPGWYGGRAIHIHFTVRVGGQEYVTSQLYFPDPLTVEIFATHPDYVQFGQPDTMNTTDGFFAGAQEILETAKQADGALLAYKTLVIRSSLADPLC